MRHFFEERNKGKLAAVAVLKEKGKITFLRAQKTEVASYIPSVIHAPGLFASAEAKHIKEKLTYRHRWKRKVKSYLL